MEPTMERTFEPGRYLTKVNGADYLEVKWRLVWLRQEHPDAVIETQLVEHEGNQAVVRASVTIPGGGAASGFGSEAQNNFHNYIEKAETKAIGRALGALGFGTQFAPDFDFGADQGQVVDSPVNLRPANGNHGPTGNQGAAPARPTQPPPRFNDELPPVRADFHIVQSPLQPGTQATDKQVNLILSLGNELGVDDRDLEYMTGGDPYGLNRRQASDVIGQLNARKAALGAVAR